jgi:hypothetical protein
MTLKGNRTFLKNRKLQIPLPESGAAKSSDLIN